MGNLANSRSGHSPGRQMDNRGNSLWLRTEPQQRGDTRTDQQDSPRPHDPDSLWSHRTEVHRRRLEPKSRTATRNGGTTEVRSSQVGVTSTTHLQGHLYKGLRLHLPGAPRTPGQCQGGGHMVPGPRYHVWDLHPVRQTKPSELLADSQSNRAEASHPRQSRRPALTPTVPRGRLPKTMGDV